MEFYRVSDRTVINVSQIVFLSFYPNGTSTVGMTFGERIDLDAAHTQRLFQFLKVDYVQTDPPPYSR